MKGRRSIKKAERAERNGIENKRRYFGKKEMTKRKRKRKKEIERERRRKKVRE